MDPSKNDKKKIHTGWLINLNCVVPILLLFEIRLITYKSQNINTACMFHFSPLKN